MAAPARRATRGSCPRAAPGGSRRAGPPTTTIFPAVGDGGRRTLADGQAGDRAADDEALDLGGALEDGEDLGVAVEALDRVVAGVAGAAEDLDGLFGDPDGGLAGDELAHRALGLAEGPAVAGHPRGPPGEQAGDVDPGGHVGEEERDRLVLADLAAELLALERVVAGVLVGGPGHADRHRGDRGPGGLEGAHRRVVAAALALAGPGEPLVEPFLAAEQALAGDADVVEDDLGGVRGADAVLA